MQSTGIIPVIRFRPPSPVNSGFKGERKVGRSLRETGVPILEGAFINDLGRERELDILALLGNRIWVVEVKSSHGHPPRWTADGIRMVGPQTLEKARRQLRCQIEALARLIPEAEIAGLIVFSERVHIDPPGPEAITLAALPAFVARERDGLPSCATLRAWQGLCVRRPDLCGLRAGTDEHTSST